MAIWHFDIAFVPVGSDRLALTNRGHELVALPPVSIARARRTLESAFGPPCAETPDTVSYGQLDGNRMDLVELGPGCHALWAAIDARSNGDYFCKLVCALAANLGCELFSPSLEHRFAPVRRSLMHALTSSQAWVYAIAPEGFQRIAQGWSLKQQ